MHKEWKKDSAYKIAVLVLIVFFTMSHVSSIFPVYRKALAAAYSAMAGLFR